MLRPQFDLDLHREIACDNFAGGGGWSTGYELATGRPVEHAINHSREALAMHRMNHPKTVHHQEDMYDVDPRDIAQGRPGGIAHFSSDCRHFSKAKGGKPVSKKIRGLVLLLLRWAVLVRPRVISMENVSEIQTFGPVKRMRKNGKLGWYPHPKHKGRTWKAMLAILSTGVDPRHPDLDEILSVVGPCLTSEMAVQGLGYHVEHRVIRAYLYGSSTIRSRLYMLARCDGKPIVWPEATHENPAKLDLHPGKRLRPWNIIADKIDWTIPCPSIFWTKAEAKERGFKVQRPLKNATLKRLAFGVDRFVLKNKRPYIVNLTHQGNDGNRVHSADEPLSSITGAKRGEKAVVVPGLTKFHGSHKGRQDGASRSHPVTDPLQTSDTSNRFGLFAANLAVNTSGHPGSAADAPMSSLTTGNHEILTAGTLIQTGYGEAEGQAPRALDLQKPGGTAVAGGCKQAFVSGTLVHAAHGETAHDGKSRRGRGAVSVEEACPTLTTSKDLTLGATSLVKLNGNPEPDPSDAGTQPAPAITAGGGHLGAMAVSLTKFTTGSTGSEVTEPIKSITAGSHSEETHGGAATVHGINAVYLAQHNAGYNQTPGHPVTDPISAISSKGSQQQLVAVHAETYYSSGTSAGAADAPARTIRTEESTAAVQSTILDSFIAATMTPEQVAGARRVAAFLRAFGVEFEGEFAKIEGYVLVDIGMRMLNARELFGAQGFPASYIIDRGWVIDPVTGEIQTIYLTKEQQIKMVGNSVCPDVACALVRANVPEMIAHPGRERPRHQRVRLTPTNARTADSHHPALPMEGMMSVA